MKKYVWYMLCAVTVFFLAACGDAGIGHKDGFESKMQPNLNKGYFGFEKKDFDVVDETDSHGGFHGDGTYFLILDCSKNKELSMKLVKDWKVLPLTENLHTILYGNDTYGALLLEEEGSIPVISNGYYYFYDRHSESIDFSDDTELLHRYSYNFTLAIYDSDTDIMYYVEFDT